MKKKELLSFSLPPTCSEAQLLALGIQFSVNPIAKKKNFADSSAYMNTGAYCTRLCALLHNLPNFCPLILFSRIEVVCKSGEKFMLPLQTLAHKLSCVMKEVPVGQH